MSNMSPISSGYQLGPVNNVPPNLLGLILTHALWPGSSYVPSSLARCSSVSKSWAEGVINAKIILIKEGKIGFQDLHPGRNFQG